MNLIDKRFDQVFAELRADREARLVEMQTLRAEMQTGFAGLRTEIAALRADLSAFQRLVLAIVAAFGVGLLGLLGGAQL